MGYSPFLHKVQMIGLVEAALEQEVRQLTVELAEERGQRESLAAQLEEANGNLKVARQKRKPMALEPENASGV